MDLTIKELVKMIVDDWKWQVKEMTDEELKEDRSEWMKKYGIPHNDDGEDEILWSDIHTISIEIEQLRRFGEIQYGDPVQKRKKRITED
jgi:hypothetical protein